MAKRHHSSKRKHHSRHMEHEHDEYGSGNMHEPHGEPQGDVNKKRGKWNDQDRSDRDEQPRGMYRGPLTSGELYAGMPSRMRTELEDGQMISEDHRAIANLPQEVMIKAYPRTGPYMPEDLEDSILGVDAQMDYDDSHRRAHFYPKKV